MTTISVVVFGYRNEDTIVRAVESLLEQGAAEIIVVTSGGDASAERVRRRCAGVTLIEHAGRLFPGGARNLGLKAARSEVVAFLEGDCVAEPGWVVSRVALHAAKRRAVASAITNGGPHSPAGWAAHYLLFASRMPGRPAGTVIPPDPAVHGLSVAREELLAMAGFREDLRTGEDTEVAWRLRARGIEILFDPAVRTAHFGPGGTMAMLIDQFRRGRLRAHTSRHTRSSMALLARAPREVYQRVRWIVRQAWRHAVPPERVRIVLVLPWIAAGAAANCAGWLREQLVMVRT